MLFGLLGGPLGLAFHWAFFLMSFWIWICKKMGINKPYTPCDYDEKFNKFSAHVLLEEQIPKEVHEVSVVDLVFIKRYIREIPNILSNSAILEQVSNSFRCRNTGFTSGVFSDLSMVEVGFSRKDIFACFPGEEFNLVKDEEVPNLAPKSVLTGVMGFFCQNWSLGHGQRPSICTIDSETLPRSVCPNHVVLQFVAT